MKQRSYRAITATLIAGAAVAALGAASAAPANAEPVSQPPVVPSSSSPPTGSIMPKFTDVQSKPVLRATGEQPYSVTIDSAPTEATPGQAVTITGHTTGFSAGNWINVWVRLPDGTQLDDGGIIAPDGSFTIPITLAYAGTNTIQLSAGTWPIEQWSAPVSIHVGETPTTPSMVATAATYHNLSGHTVVVFAAQQNSEWRQATFNPCPSSTGKCETHIASDAGYGWYVKVYTPEPGSFLYGLAPNNTDFQNFVTYQNP